jgi:hypothetical protein
MFGRRDGFENASMLKHGFMEEFDKDMGLTSPETKDRKWCWRQQLDAGFLNFERKIALLCDLMKQHPSQFFVFSPMKVERIRQVFVHIVRQHDIFSFSLFSSHNV